jgi:hypothetical protein
LRRLINERKTHYCSLYQLPAKSLILHYYGETSLSLHAASTSLKLFNKPQYCNLRHFPPPCSHNVNSQNSNTGNQAYVMPFCCMSHNGHRNDVGGSLDTNHRALIGSSARAIADPCPSAAWVHMTKLQARFSFPLVGFARLSLTYRGTRRSEERCCVVDFQSVLYE